MIELKPCPFCGSAADVQNDFGQVFWPQCKNLACGATDGREYPNEREAAAAWNQRAPVKPADDADAGEC